MRERASAAGEESGREERGPEARSVADRGRPVAGNGEEGKAGTGTANLRDGGREHGREQASGAGLGKGKSQTQEPKARGQVEELQG